MGKTDAQVEKMIRDGLSALEQKYVDAATERARKKEGRPPAAPEDVVSRALKRIKG